MANLPAIQPVRLWGGWIRHEQPCTLFDVSQPYDVTWEMGNPPTLPAHRRRSRAMGQGVIRDYLAPHLAARQVDFSHYPSGAPRLLCDGEDVLVSLSHTRDMVAVLLASDPHMLIGIDLAHNQGRNFADLMERVLTRQERRWLKQAADFYHVWTLKEAALKAWGVGMRVAPWEVEVLFEEVPLRIVSRVGDFPPLTGATFFLAGDVYLSCAWTKQLNYPRDPFLRPRALHLGC